MSSRTISLSLLLLLVRPLIGAECNRTFETPVRFGTAAQVSDIVAGDFNSDGRPDLLVATGASELSLLLNRGGRSFAFAMPVAMPGPTLRFFRTPTGSVIALGARFLATVTPNGDGTFRTVTTTVGAEALNFSSAVAAGDFDGDGRTDLVAGVTRVNRNGFLRFFRGLADGTFVEPRPTATLDRQIFVMQTGEFTGDAFLDLAYADRSKGGVLPGNGDGTFGPRQIVSDSAPLNVVVGDFDEDNRDDLLFPFALYLTTASMQPRAASVSGGQPVDLDGDGKLDLLLSGTVHRGNGDGTFQPVSAGSVGPLTSFSAVADFDGDGKLDVAAGTIDDVTIRYGLGGARLDAGSVFLAGYSLTAMLAGDLNNDGRADLVTVSFDDVLVYLASPGGALHRTARYAASFSDDAALGDFNGDGKLDLLYSREGLALGNGDGTFAPPVEHGLSLGSGPIAVGDLNGDGNLDFAHVQSSVTRAINNGAGKFTATETATQNGGSAIAIADFNRDGRADIVMPGTNQLILIDSASPATTIAIPTPVQVSSDGFQAADFDGDSLADVVALLPDGTPILFGGNGNGTFRAPVVVAGPVEKSEGHDVAVADFTGDGRADLFVTSLETYVAQLFAQQPDGSFVETARIPSGHWFGASPGDFDGDGHPDIVINEGKNSLVAAHLNRCREELRIPQPLARLTASGRTLVAEVPSDARGTVTFLARAKDAEFWKKAAIGTVPVINGRAALTTTLAPGSYVFWAVYSGEEQYVRADATPIVHTVTDSTTSKRRTARH